MADDADVIQDWSAAAQARLDALAKPPGSLGTLETWAVTLCRQQKTLAPTAGPAAVIVFCADHGVKATHAELSPFPQVVGVSIFKALCAGVAGAAALAASAGATCTTVDVGLCGDVSSATAGAGCVVRHDKLADGSHDLLETEALGEALRARALAAGASAVAAEVAERQVTVVAIGEVGIGNTTAAAAMLAALTGADAAECCGRGTGLDDAGVAHKVGIVRRALDVHAEAVASADASRILSALGGLEIAAMVGAYHEAHARGLVAVVDGFISSVAALCAVRMKPEAREAMVLATASAERGGAIASAALECGEPALRMGLRLGEGSGAAAALPLLKAAACLLTNMATLEEAMRL